MVLCSWRMLALAICHVCQVAADLCAFCSTWNSAHEVLRWFCVMCMQPLEFVLSAGIGSSLVVAVAMVSTCWEGC
jgi:hypothetical protein